MRDDVYFLGGGIGLVVVKSIISIISNEGQESGMMLWLVGLSLIVTAFLSYVFLH